MKSPTVSVVMSVYNGADTLARTLQSILDQQGCDFEFIVVDDGSTDGSAAILDKWAGSDDRLRVIHQQNTGLTRALILGCAESQGEFIARQDCGDISLPGRLEKQVAALRADSKISFVSAHTRYVDDDDESLYVSSGTGIATRPMHIIDLDRRHGVLDGPTSHPSVMLRKTSYIKAGGYRQEFHFGQDWDLWYRLAEVGLFQMIPVIAYEARVGVGDISTSNKALQEKLAALSLASFRLRLSGKSDAPVLAQAHLLRPQRGKKPGRSMSSGARYFLGECLRRNGSLPKARAYFRAALKDDPSNLKAWVRLAQIWLAKKPTEPAA